MDDDRASGGKPAAPPEPRGTAAAPFRRLLVPLDGSRLAEAVLGPAARLADAYGATIVLLHVIERNAAPQVHGEPHLTATAESEAYLAGVAARLSSAGRDVRSHTHDVPVGDVARSIAAHAEEHGVDLTLLCTHGEGGLAEALWGSIAQQVVQRSTRPVLLVRAGLGPRAAAAGAGPDFAPESIMVPLDGTAVAESAIPPAASLAARLGAELRLVLVVGTVATIPAGEMPAATFLPRAARELLDAEERQAAGYLEGLASGLRAAAIPAAAEVRRGDAATELASDAAEHADGLVVIATHGRAGLQAVWNRSVADRLLRRTAAPVLLVPIVE
jgi:nucleotide-binding universal stress UspA family protein